jgi:hypothetical protein
LNTVGNGIGHDLKATLDNETSVVLNEFYASDLDTYQSGRVVYPLSDLEEGPHVLSLKAWDVHNNSATAKLDFVVVSDLEVFLDGLINYPNPIGAQGTTFRFDHNQACVALEMSLQIYDSRGVVVWSGQRTETPTGYRVDGWHWDGTSSGGEPLGMGTYLYRLDIRTPEGRDAAKTGRLVLLH